LLAAGCTAQHIQRACGFESLRSAQGFCRDDEVKRAVAEQAGQRAGRLGTRALVVLERILSERHTDLRATVLAVRTALEVSGFLRKDIAAPLKHVHELTVPELTQLIEQTRTELEQRRARRADAVSIPGQSIQLNQRIASSD